MVFEIPNAKIIVEGNYERYEFDAARAQIGSMNGGRTHFLTTTELLDKQKTPISAVRGSHNASVDYTKPPAPEQCPHEKALIGAAKAQERATLNAARIIEKAHEQAEALINDADHTLNGAIQAYLHTSKTAVDVARVLDKAGIYYNEVRGQNVAALNTPDLYLLDATELLTVG